MLSNVMLNNSASMRNVVADLKIEFTDTHLVYSL